MRLAHVKTGLLIAAALWLTACVSSPPLRFYSLAAPTAAASNVGQSRSTPLLIAVAPVNVPERLARPQLVLQQRDSARMEVLEQDRWIAPFNQELRDTLANGIAAQLGAVDVRRAVRQTGLPLYRITVDLRQFDALSGVQVNAAFAWTVSRSDDERTVSCQLALSVPVSAAGTEALVVAMQQSVAAAVDAIAATVRNLQGSAAGGCGI